MSDASELVSALYESCQARDWAAAAEVLHAEVQLRMPATGEVHDGRDAVMALQENYPEPWGDLSVLRVVGNGADTAAAEIEILGPSEVFRCAAFWEVRDGRLHRGAEYWVTVGGDEPGPRP